MTRWTFPSTIRADAPQVIDWVRAYLSSYDLSELERLRVVVVREHPDKETWQGVHGYCDYPQGRGKRKQGFRIYCEVTGPYPYTLNAGGTRIRNLGEAVAWIVGHEARHFLTESKQVRGRDTEAEANAAGKAAVRHYRAFTAAKRPATRGKTAASAKKAKASKRAS